MAKQQELPKVNLVRDRELSGDVQELHISNLDGFEKVIGGLNDLGREIQSVNYILAGMLDVSREQLENQEDAARLAREQAIEGARTGPEMMPAMTQEMIDKLNEIANGIEDGNEIKKEQNSPGFWTRLLGGLGITAFGAKALGAARSAIGLADKASAVSKVTGKVGGVVDKGKNILGPKVAGAISKANIATAIALNLKDAIDIGMAGLDDDIETEIEGQDVGGLVGGIVGGGIGLVLGGPAGAAFGASIGNSIGEALGEMVDPNTNEMVLSMKERMVAQNEKLKEKFKNIEGLLQAGAIDQEEYARRKEALIAEQEFLKQQAAEFDVVELAKKERHAAAQKYNAMKAALEKQEELGVEITEDQKRMLEELEIVYNKASTKYDQAAKDLEKKLDVGLLADQAEDLGVYEDRWFGFLGRKDTIDMDKAQGLSVAQLQALLEQGDFEEQDYKSIQDLITQKMKSGETKMSQEFQDALKDSANMKGGFEGTGEFSQEELYPEPPPPVEPTGAATPSSGNEGAKMNQQSKQLEQVKASVNVNNVTAPTNVVNNTTTNVQNQSVITPTPIDRSNRNRANQRRTAQGLF